MSVHHEFVFTQEVVSRLQAGDENSWAEAFIHLQRMIFHYLRKDWYTLSDEDHEDLASDIFLRMRNALPEVQYTDSRTFENWVYMITKNLLRSDYRNKRRLKRSANVIPLEERTLRHFNIHDEFPEEEIFLQIQIKEMMEKIPLLVEQLLPDQRQAFELFYYEELSYEEIAEALGKTVSSIKQLLHRAKTSIRQQLTHQFGRLY